VVAGNRTEWASRADFVIVLESSRIRFQGSFDDLRAEAGRSEIEITTTDIEGALALAGPFALDVRESDDALTIRAKEGQEVAAKLLAEGYGAVRALTLSEPTTEELVRSILRPK
jgi:hypothetical protein